VGKQDRQVMLIWGTLDEDITPEMIQQIRDRIPDLQFEQLEGLGHDPQVIVADRINKLIIDFLKQ